MKVQRLSLFLFFISALIFGLGTAAMAEESNKERLLLQFETKWFYNGYDSYNYGQTHSQNHDSGELVMINLTDKLYKFDLIPELTLKIIGDSASYLTQHHEWITRAVSITLDGPTFDPTTSLCSSSPKGTSCDISKKIYGLSDDGNTFYEHDGELTVTVEFQNGKIVEHTILLSVDGVNP